MDPETIVQLIEEGLAVEKLVQGWISSIRAKSGLTDDQILDAAKAKDDDTHARVAALLAQISAAA